jgi:hypothetical protein
VQAAVDKLADSLRPDADEPIDGRRRILMPRPEKPGQAPLMGVATIGVARGRTVSEPVTRREFRRTDTLVVRALLRSSEGSVGQVLLRSSGASEGQAEAMPVTSGRLLDRRGQALTDLPVTQAGAASELRLPLGNLGPGDYVIEITARSGDQVAQQFLAFRVAR